MRVRKNKPSRGDIIRGAGGLLKRNTDLGVSIGPPIGGNEGDIRVNMVNQQPRLYARAGEKWYTAPLFETAGTAITEDVVSGENFLRITGKGGMIDFSAGGRNIILGSKDTKPLKSLTTGLDNIAIGKDALKVCAAGNNNIAIGFEALVNNTGSNSIGIGIQAGMSSNSPNSVAIGHNAYASENSIALGYFAIAPGSTSVAIGRSSYAGNNALALGYGANSSTGGIAIGYNCTSDTNKISIGVSVLHANNCFSIGGGSDKWIIKDLPSGTGYIGVSTGTTGGTGTAGSGNEYVELKINNTVYKVLHDGTV